MCARRRARAPIRARAVVVRIARRGAGGGRPARVVPALQPGERALPLGLLLLLLLLRRVLAAEGRAVVVLLIAADDRGQLGARGGAVGADARRGAAAQRRASEGPALVRELVGAGAGMCALEEAAFVAELDLA